VINFEAAFDREVLAGANTIIEKGDAGIDAAAGNDVERVRTDACLFGAVEVHNAREPLIDRCLDERVE
jgi:hypothetical protein